MPPGLWVSGMEPAVPQFPHCDLGELGLKTTWVWEMLIVIFGVLFPSGGWMLGGVGGPNGCPPRVPRADLHWGDKKQQKHPTP